MSCSIESGFIFALVNPGSEKALKLEAEVMGLGWRLSYQRRGFVTFKSDGPFTLESLEVDPACARRLCLSLGKFATRDEAMEAVRADHPHAIIHHARYFERRMEGLPCDEFPGIGQLIGTVVELGPGEYWAGIHRHRAWISPWPAGDAGMVMPEDSPSRAWLKLEEAVRFFGLEFKPSDIVVELGCAPGGVVLALLQRGVSVIGVDPAKMAAVVDEWAIPDRNTGTSLGPWFWHCRKPAALVGKRDLGSDATWFMSDMNQAPEVVLTECARFRRMCPAIHGVLITLKLTDLSRVVDKESWFRLLEEMGFGFIRLQQLSAHHKEFALLAMTSNLKSTIADPAGRAGSVR